MNAHELLDLFLAAQASQNHSVRTIDWYRYEVGRFFAWLQTNNLHNGNWLHAAVIERYLADSRSSGNQPATVAGHYRGLRVFFAWLVERHYIERSPLADVKPPKVPKKQPKRAVLSEFVRLLDSLPEDDWIGLRDRLIVNVLFLCGVRLGECTRLRAVDFQTAQHTLAVDGKTGPRLVPLVPAVERAFMAYLFARPGWKDDHLFLAADGARQPKGVILPGGIYQMLRRHCRTAGMRMLNPHSFRHGLAMLMLNERHADMSLVQKVLGHSQISTTAAFYAEWLTDGMVKEFVEKMRGLGPKA
jgi:site-specific recombinase XerD